MITSMMTRSGISRLTPTMPSSALPALLTRLAVASPAADVETTTRLWLKALAASDDGQGVKADAALRERVKRVLADPAQARAQLSAPVHRVLSIAWRLAKGLTW